LLASYVDVLANPKPVVNPVGVVTVDPELERERLAFEKQKWEANCLSRTLCLKICKPD